MTGDTATLDTASAVLSGLRSVRQVELSTGAKKLALAVHYAAMHSPDSIIDAACFGDSPIPVAGPGAPLVAEFSVADFAAALGMSTENGKYYLGEAVELAHRLPRTYARVPALELPKWRARRIARATIGLSPEAAEFVDRHIAAVAHKIGPAATDRLVDQAIAQFMPTEARIQRDEALERRHFDVDTRQVSFAGSSRVTGELDLADAQDLEAAVAAEAQRQKDLGSTEPLDVRRAKALANLARRDLTLDLETGQPAPVTRETVIVVHLGRDGVTATVDSPHRLITVDQAKEWCGNPFTRVTIKPVIDLDDHVTATGYRAPEALVEQVDLRDRTCVFPWCTRPASRCDHDHVIPHGAAGGPTCSCNLAPLCRRHHRLKTHGSWAYTAIDPGAYLWTSPHGYQFLRDPTGTQDVSRDRPSRPPPDD